MLREPVPYAALVVLGALACLCAGCKDVQLSNLNGVPVLDVSGCDPFSLGHTIGKTFASQIRSHANSSLLFTAVKALQQISPGARSKITALHALHRRQFPVLVAQLEGMAQGSGVPLDDLLMHNFFVELLEIVQADPQTPALLARFAANAGADAAASLACPAGCKCPPASQTPGGCSDVIVALGPYQAGAGPQGRLLLGHNEDWTADNQNATFFLIHREAGLSYIADYTFGSLAGDVANSAGISCTAEFVTPLRPLVPGAARQFVLAQLVAARSLQEVVEMAAYPGQAIGRTYNCIDMVRGLAANIETGPNGSISVVHFSSAPPPAKAAATAQGRGSFDAAATPVSISPATTNWYYHSNMFKHLAIPQHVEDSSLAREARVLQLSANPPTTTKGLLTMLGDTANPKHPIYRTLPGDRGTDCDPLSQPLITLYTLLVDGNARTFDYYEGNPAPGKGGKRKFTVNLRTFKAVAT